MVPPPLLVLGALEVFDTLHNPTVAIVVHALAGFEVCVHSLTLPDVRLCAPNLVVVVRDLHLRDGHGPAERNRSGDNGQQPPQWQLEPSVFGDLDVGFGGFGGHVVAGLVVES